MKRIHIHVGVKNIGASKKFYAELFESAPAMEKADYARWDLADPAVHFAISAHTGTRTGIDHVGVQADRPEELATLAQRLAAVRFVMTPEPGARCCYAKSDKHWVADPDAVVWEMFHTTGEIATYGEDRSIAP